MKKVANVFEGKTDSLENTKRVTKNVSEHVNRVDQITSSARTCGSLFNIQAISTRIRLREACERALSIRSTAVTQKMEEILWRKVFYEPLSAAKKLRNGSAWTDVECGFIWAHLNDGIAFYHHYLMGLAAVSCRNSNQPADLLPLAYFDEEESIGKSNDQTQSTSESFFRSLTCLGDLARYMLDLPSQVSHSNSYLLSVRYYHQALHYNCEGGLTHSNLATVYSSSNYHLLAALHYLRALTCEKPFVAAESNLRKMLDRSRLWLENKKLTKESTKEGSIEKESIRFLHTCLALLSCFINNRKMEEVAVLCQEVLMQLGKLLDNYDNIDPPDVSESSTDQSESVKSKSLNGFIDSPLNQKSINISDEEKKNSDTDDIHCGFLLTPESMVTQCALFILCIKRLKMRESCHSNMSEVLLISILLTLVSHINTRLEQRFSLSDPTFIQKLLPTPEDNPKIEDENENEKEKTGLCNGDKTEKKKKKSKLSKLRRRKNKGQDDHEDEEDSDIEENGLDVESDSNTDSDAQSLSDEVEEFDSSILCSSEDDDSDEDVKIESEEVWQGMTAEEHLDIVEQEEMLAAVHVLLRWLLSNGDMIKMCGKAAHNLWISLSKLFNLIRVDFNEIECEGDSVPKKEIIDSLQSILKGSAENHTNIDETLGNLPENLMLHSVLPDLKQSLTRTAVNNSELNLLRLCGLNDVMGKLCKHKDVPLKLKDGKYVKCEEKSRLIAEATKLENEKASEGRSSPAIFNKPPPSSPTMHSSQIESIISKPKSDSNPSTPIRNPHNTKSNKMTSSMQSLTAQWLQHEVKNLEQKTSVKMGAGGLYLVPDASVLIHHLSTIKKLLAAPSHMVIIPQVVIDSLDQQKKESVGARDAIRWLEIKLRHGSRFMRAQRPHEKSHIPLIKYPKRKDKEAWEWIQLVECCYYLGAQMNKCNPKTSTVTLLTTEDSVKVPKGSLSLKTLAEAAGSKLLSVDEFVRKFQPTSKAPS